jgi:hypothetical protein
MGNCASPQKEEKQHNNMSAHYQPYFDALKKLADYSIKLSQLEENDPDDTRLAGQRLAEEGQKYRQQVEELVSQPFESKKQKTDLIIALLGGPADFDKLPVFVKPSKVPQKEEKSSENSTSSSSSASEESEIITQDDLLDSIPDFSITKVKSTGFQVCLKINKNMYQSIGCEEYDEEQQEWFMGGTGTVFIVPHCGGGPTLLFDEDHKPLKMALVLIHKMVEIIIKAKKYTKNDEAYLQHLIEIIASINVHQLL